MFPKENYKEEVFDEATKEREINTDRGEFPDGEYFYTRKIEDLVSLRGQLL